MVDSFFLQIDWTTVLSRSFFTDDATAFKLKPGMPSRRFPPPWTVEELDAYRRK